MADREFCSHELFSWCNNQEHKIPFYIRIKDNALVRIPKCKGRGYPIKRVFNSLKANEQTSYPYPITLYGCTIYVAGSRSETGELMVVATNQPPQNAIMIYLMRWEIETLFSCSKERGFNFEDTHMTHQDRIEKLMAVLAMAVAWVHKIGEWRASIKPITFKKFKNRQHRPQYSYFRYGLDYLRESLLQINTKITQLMDCLSLIRPEKTL